MQWFFVRLARCTGTEKIIQDVKIGWENEQLNTDDCTARVYWFENKYQCYGIYGFVLPLTGWFNDYVNIGKSFCKQITRKNYVTR